ncbi:hypothetical protein LXL04_024317 [Taraxacum kok-saghyz]
MGLTNLTLVTFILFLTITLQIQNVEGRRHLKQNNIHLKETSQLNATEPLQTKPMSTKTTVDSQPPPPPPRSAQDFRPTMPVCSHAISLAEGRKLKDVTGFRPTTPGNSPGAGHSFTENRPDAVLGNESDIHHSVNSESGTAFRPTKPGNSPGAGHSIHNYTDIPKV